MMGIFMLGFWGLVAWVVVTLVRNTSSPGREPHPQHSAEEILAERFARGEIDHDEFVARRDALRARR
jgi:putative membrane protein